MILHLFIAKIFRGAKKFSRRKIYDAVAWFATDDVSPRGGGHFFLVLRRRNGASRGIGERRDGNGRLNVVITLN